MHTKYSLGLAALAAGLVSITSASAASAASFDPHKCAVIQNVDVPYEVSFDAGRIIFNNHGRQIVVAPAYMEMNGRRFADANLSAAYYRNLRAFLHDAGAFPKTAAEFGKTAFLPGHSEARQNFVGGITAMCHSILTLAEDQKRMRGVFADFRAPVEITLSRSAL